jgi:hypothetical protein
MYVNPDHIAEIRVLTESKDFDGKPDISLAERRETFKRITGTITTLSDDQLIAAIAATNDDDDDLFVTNVKHIEQHGYTTEAATAS